MYVWCSIINSTRRSVFLVWFSVYRVFFLFLHLRSLRCCSTQKHIDRIATHTWKKRERISKRLFSGYVAKTLWLAKKPSAHRRKKKYSTQLILRVYVILCCCLCAKINLNVTAWIPLWKWNNDIKKKFHCKNENSSLQHALIFFF